jgi:hypothetical protein
MLPIVANTTATERSTYLRCCPHPAVPLGQRTLKGRGSVKLAILQRHRKKRSRGSEKAQAKPGDFHER